MILAWLPRFCGEVLLQLQQLVHRQMFKLRRSAFVSLSSPTPVVCQQQIVPAHHG
jgi:hypothetical protein